MNTYKYMLLGVHEQMKFFIKMSWAAVLMVLFLGKRKDELQMQKKNSECQMLRNMLKT